MELITGSALHVITGSACNRKQPLQAVITGQTDIQALQDEPVITSNQPVVIAPLVMSRPADSDPVIAIESTYGTPVPTTPSQIEEKICQPSMSVEEQLWRLDRVHEAITARLPKHCPACGSSEILPLFRPDPTIDTIKCQRCGALFSGRGD